jgi:non-canonical (house-cleaning) NTP pyrophosphatase
LEPPRVALASLREPKIHAVRAVLDRLAELDPGSWSGVELVIRSTPSGVAATPLSDDELKLGAQSRAVTLQATLEAEGQPAALYLGLEGGVHAPPGEDAAWLRCWCYAWDGRRGVFGCGPSVLLPECIAAPLRAGEDLGDVIDRVAKGKDVRSQGGTWGHVTRGLLSRSTAFETAVVAALAPFYHADLFDR